MELTVYRQASRVRPNGTVIYKGEDTLPFVGKEIFFVADGLGGAAAIRHVKFDQDMFDEDKLMDVLFQGIYEDYSDETFTEYTKKAFFELMAVKDCYTDNVNNIKKSGYFASRLVSCIMLHEFLYNPDAEPDKIFAKIAEFKDDPESLRMCLDKLGESIRDSIKDNLGQISKKVNLIYESSMTGMALLGTTLCCTVFFEHEDSVEALYFTAGDSRPYVWTKAEGLAQLLPDEEGTDGGMTNYIRADEGSDFHIRCDYFTFQKPCILFNASDGCFDSGYFLSQMAFEKLILESAVDSADEQGMAQKLDEFFQEAGRHDDSSTIAMKMFGFESFDELREAAASRMGVMQVRYLSRMPDVLDTDFKGKLEEMKSRKPRSEDELIAKIGELPAVRSRCREDVLAGKYPEYDAAVAEIEEKIARINAHIKNARNGISDIISVNYRRFVPFLEEGYEPEETDAGDDVLEKLKYYQEKLELGANAMRELLERIFESAAPGGEDLDPDAEGMEIVGNCERIMNELYDSFSEMSAKKDEALKRIVVARKEYTEENVLLASEHPEDLERLTEMVMNGVLDITKTGVSEADLEGLTEALNSIKAADDGIEVLESGDKKDALEKAVGEYWEKNKDSLVDGFLKEEDILPSELASELRTLRSGDEGTEELRNKAEQQEAIFSEYEQEYGRYMEVSDK